MTSTRLFADRRRGVDRRAAPRRKVVASLPPHPRPERRRVVDRRGGAERRSTLDRRNRVRRFTTLSVETPGEHLRNALQLVQQALTPHPGDDPALDLAAALVRLHRALQLLEPR